MQNELKFIGKLRDLQPQIGAIISFLINLSGAQPTSSLNTQNHEINSRITMV